MKINLQGASNARDIGGIVTPFGTVATGRLLRSGHHNKLTDQDVQTLLSHGLTRVVDLRTATEMQNVPDRKIDGVEYTHNSIIRQTTFGISYTTLDGTTIATKLEQGVERMRANGEMPMEHMRILYKRFVNDSYSRNAYGTFLNLLANTPKQGATLWHCSVGKDRVGTCTALLLHCLGASQTDILADYMLTNEQTMESNQSVLNKVAPYVSPQRLDLVKTMIMVEESYLQSFWTEIDEKFGNVQQFLQQCGVTEQTVQRLLQNYLV